MFDGDSHDIHQIVLLDAVQYEVSEKLRHISTSNECATVFADSVVWDAEFEYVNSTAFLDCFEIALDRHECCRWIGQGPVLFGLSDHGLVSRIAIL